MKTEKEIIEVADEVYAGSNVYSERTYETGVFEALMWVIDELSYDDFNYRGKT